jgi:hypothetical protein
MQDLASDVVNDGTELDDRPVGGSGESRHESQLRDLRGGGDVAPGSQVDVDDVELAGADRNAEGLYGTTVLGPMMA